MAINSVTKSDTVPARPYISTLALPGQALWPLPLLTFVWILGLVAALQVSCSTAPSATIGDDEMVGHPEQRTPGVQDPPLRHGALWYRIEPRDDELSIQVRLLDPPKTSTFFFPGPWAGRGDFDERITLVSARGPDALMPMTVERNQGRIDIETRAADWVELSYRVETTTPSGEAQRFFPWQTDDAFFAYAPTILILPSAGISQVLRDIPIEVHAPSDWIVASTWPRHEPDAQPAASTSLSTGFVADDIRSLRDALIGAGRHWKRLQTPLSNGELAVTFTSDFDLDYQAFLDTVSIICEAYLDEFGIYKHISAMVMQLPDDAPDSLRGTGRHGGFVLEIPAHQQLDDKLLLLLAHEALHMWNGHHLVPTSEAADDTTWFKEGVTHYIALKTLARLHLIDEKTVRQELARAGQFYLHNPLIAGGPIRSVDRTRLPYDKGMLIALKLDISLLNDSGGNIGIEQWVASLLAPPFDDDGRAYDLDVLQHSLRDLSTDIGDQSLHHFEKYVAGNDTIDVHALFRQLGLHFLDAARVKPARLLPIDGETDPYYALFGLYSPPGTDHELH